MEIKMKYIFSLSLIFLFGSCSTITVQRSADVQKDITSIREAIHGSIGWAKTKNFTQLYNIISNDSDYMEIDPNPGIIRGFSEFKMNEAFWASLDFKAIRYEIRDLKINISKSGDAAWFYCILDDVNEWKGKPASWLNTRWTGVLEKRENCWVIVQMHFSFASDK